MSDASLYWSQLCKLVPQLRCWVRVASQERGKMLERRWGQLLAMPTDGYLEASGGLTSLADVEWVEVSVRRVLGGIAGRPRQMVEIKDDILASLRGTSLTWKLLDGSWSIEGVFDEEPVQVVRVLNPFRPTAAEPS